MRKNNKELFWDATIDEVKNGFIEAEECYKCIICEKEFIKGRIYDIDSILYDAKKATKLHIEKIHKSTLQYLLEMNNTFTGIS